MEQKIQEHLAIEIANKAIEIAVLKAENAQLLAELRLAKENKEKLDEELERSGSVSDL